MATQITNLPELRGLLKFLRNAHRVPEGQNEGAWLRAAIAQAVVELEGVLAALEEHTFEGMSRD